MPSWRQITYTEIAGLFGEYARSIRGNQLDVGRHNYALGLSHGVRKNCRR
jgi:hypothetical protein